MKLLHRQLEQTIEVGLEQTTAYLDRCGAAEGHLIILDRTPGNPWEEKLFRQERKVRGKRVTVWGM